METLRQVTWEAFSAAERGRLSTTHPDPVARETATTPLAAWARSEELVELITDPDSLVRKSAT